MSDIHSPLTQKRLLHAIPPSVKNVHLFSVHAYINLTSVNLSMYSFMTLMTYVRRKVISSFLLENRCSCNNIIYTSSFVFVFAFSLNGNISLSLTGLWALINAATFCVCGELEWQTKDHCERQFRVNYVGVVETIRTFLPLLKAGRGYSNT